MSKNSTVSDTDFFDLIEKAENDLNYVEAALEAYFDKFFEAEDYLHSYLLRENVSECDIPELADKIDTVAYQKLHDQLQGQVEKGKFGLRRQYGMKGFLKAIARNPLKTYRSRSKVWLNDEVERLEGVRLLSEQEHKKCNDSLDVLSVTELSYQLPTDKHIFIIVLHYGLHDYEKLGPKELESVAKSTQHNNRKRKGSRVSISAAKVKSQAQNILRRDKRKTFGYEEFTPGLLAELLYLNKDYVRRLLRESESELQKLVVNG